MRLLQNELLSSRLELHAMAFIMLECHPVYLHSGSAVASYAARYNLCCYIANSSEDKRVQWRSSMLSTGKRFSMPAMTGWS